MDKFEETREYLLENHFNLKLDCGYYLDDIIEFAMDYHQKQLELTAVGCQREQLVCDCVIPKPIDAYHPIDKEICRDCNGKIAN
jgi:hypothetical protein